MAAAIAQAAAVPPVFALRTQEEKEEYFNHIQPGC